MFLPAVRHTHTVNVDNVSGLNEGGKKKNAWLHCHPEATGGIAAAGVIEGRQERMMKYWQLFSNGSA